MRGKDIQRVDFPNPIVPSPQTGGEGRGEGPIADNIEWQFIEGRRKMTGKELRVNRR